MAQVLADDLRAAVLQAAMQGKLTEQLPEDGNAKNLLDELQIKKERLIEEGIIKREKPLAPISVDEIPFEIPNNWGWVRLNTVCQSIKDGDHQPPPQSTEGVPFLVISNVSGGKLDASNTRHVPRSYFESLSNDRIGQEGDILFTVTGSYGIAVPIDIDLEFCFQRHIALLKPLCDSDYLLVSLKSPCIQSQCDEKATGIAQKTVGIKALQSMVIPIPPLAEQNRIVERVEELMAKIDEYEVLEKKLIKLKEEFPEDMKAAILLAAMRGKLTEQHVDDSSAFEAYQQIRLQKKAKIKRKEIKKEKDLDKELVPPLIVPEYWVSTYLGKVITEFIVPQRDKPKKFDGNIPWCRIEDIEGQYLNGTKSGQYVSLETVRAMNLKVNPPGAVICSCSATLGVQAINTVPCCTNQTFMGLVCPAELYNRFLLLYLQSLGKDYFIKIGSGTTIKYISQDKMSSIPLPLPPMEEQKRIVEKLDKLLPLCDQLEELVESGEMVEELKSS